MWEKVSDYGNYSSTFRMKVPGGWLVITIYNRWTSGGGAVAQTFVADSNHEWKLEDKK